MPPLTDDQKKVRDELKGPIANLVRSVNAQENLLISGFIYGTTSKTAEQPFMIRFGNIKDQGLDLIHVHYALSVMSANLNNTNGATEESLEAHAPKTTEGLADQLALALLAVPPENVTDEVTALLQQYLQSRNQE